MLRLEGSLLQHLPQELRCDRDLVTAAVQQNGRAIMWASGSLKQDVSVALEAGVRSEFMRIRCFSMFFHGFSWVLRRFQARSRAFRGRFRVEMPFKRASEPVRGGETRWQRLAVGGRGAFGLFVASKRLEQVLFGRLNSMFSGVSRPETARRSSIRARFGMLFPVFKSRGLEELSERGPGGSR